METTARNRTIGGIVIGAIILILLLVLFSCTVNSDPESSPKKDPATGESSLPSDQDTIEPEDKPSKSESDAPDTQADENDIVPAANTGVTFIPAGNVPSGSTPTCELDKSACAPTRPPGAGVDICEIRPDLDQCQPPPTTPPGDGETTPPGDGNGNDDNCVLDVICLPGGGGDDNGDDGDNPGPSDHTKPKCTTPPVVTSKTDLVGLKISYRAEWGEATDNSDSVDYKVVVDGDEVTETSRTSYRAIAPLSADDLDVIAVDPSGNKRDCGSVSLSDDEVPEMGQVDCEVISSTELKLKWKAATDDSGRIHHYTVRNTQGETADDQTKDSATFTGLDPRRTYDFEVSATDWSNNPSKPVAFNCSTDNEVPELPGVPKVDDITATTANLSWPKANDDQGIDHYEVSWVAADSLLGLGSGPVSTTDTTYSVDGLRPSTDYTFTVVAVDVADKESEPATVKATTKADGESGANLRNKSLKSPKDKVEGPTGTSPGEKDSGLPPLGDVLGGDKTEKDPAAEPSESESPAGRATTEDPAEEKDAPAEEKGGLIDGIIGSMTTAVAAVF